MLSNRLPEFAELLFEPVEDILPIEGKKEFTGIVGVFLDFQLNVFRFKVLFVFRGVEVRRFSCQGFTE